MTVVSHTEYHCIERARHPRESLPGRYGPEIRRGCAVLQAEKTGGSGLIFQQHVANQSFVALGILRAHPAFVGEGNANAAPIKGLRTQDFEHPHRRVAAGNDQTCESARAECRGESPGDLGREFARHGLGIREILHGRAGVDGWFRVHGWFRAHGWFFARVGA